MGAEPGRYRETAALFARAERVIPGGIYGHQSPRMLVPGAYPYFFARADGPRIWDVDGNEYLDLVCGYGRSCSDTTTPRSTPRRRARPRTAAATTGLAARWSISRNAWWRSRRGPAGGLREERLGRMHLGRAGRPRGDQAHEDPRGEGAYHGTHAWCAPLPGGTTPEDRAHVATYRWNDLASVDRALALHDGDVAASS